MNKDKPTIAAGMPEVVSKSKVDSEGKAQQSEGVPLPPRISQPASPIVLPKDEVCMPEPALQENPFLRGILRATQIALRSR